MSRPIYTAIHRQALTHNLSVIRQMAPDAKIWSVVKANAYGHGLLRCYDALSGTDGFALLNIEEAISLRCAGWQGPILLLEGIFRADDLALVEQYQLTITLHSDWQIEALKHARLNSAIDVYIKINTGMNRLGFPAAKAPQIWQQLAELPGVANKTLMTHFAQAEQKTGITHPFNCFKQSTLGIQAPRSVANSAAILWHPQTHLQWIRPGIILYGASPSGQHQDIAESGLQPAMSLCSEIIAIQSIEQGARVGYGGRYQAHAAQRIGIVACGYADGYPRSAPNGTPVAVDGIRTHVLGTVSMDMLAVDLTACPAATIGSHVELWGATIPIDDVATSAGTLGYELMCAITARVPIVTL